MVNSNVNALGVIFANTYDNLVPELVAERSMASIPFGGRYRPDRKSTRLNSSHITIS